MAMTYKRVYFSEHYGAISSGLQVLVDTQTVDAVGADEVDKIVRHHGRLIEAELEALSTREAQLTRAKAERCQLLALFRGRDHFVEEIKNGYGDFPYLRYVPWYAVTTIYGRITIGWRKRVIEICWKGSLIQADGGELFKAENVTRDKCSVDAWSYEKAQEYLDMLFSSMQIKEAPVA